MPDIDSIDIPCEFLELCGKWYNGQDDLLYAVASTGGLTRGDIVPSDCIDTNEDTQSRKHYLTLWRGLSSDIGSAKRSAVKMLGRVQTRISGWGVPCDSADQQEYDEACEEHAELLADVAYLVQFETWAENTVSELEAAYGLEDF